MLESGAGASYFERSGQQVLPERYEGRHLDDFMKMGVCLPLVSTCVVHIIVIQLFSYAMGVLLPEAILKLLMDINRITYVS